MGSARFSFCLKEKQKYNIRSIDKIGEWSISTDDTMCQYH